MSPLPLTPDGTQLQPLLAQVGADRTPGLVPPGMVPARRETAEDFSRRARRASGTPLPLLPLLLL
jgi:hypothetical protein